MGSAMAGMLVVGLLASALAIWSKWIWPSRLDRAELASAVNNLQKVRVPCGQPAPYAGSLASLAACGLQSGPEVGKGELVLWGDSHAAHLVPAARALAEANGLALRVRYMPECPPLIGFKPETVGVTRPKGCDRFNADVLAEVRGRQGNDRARLVILNARWLGYTRGGTDLAGLRQGLAESLAALGQLGVPVFLMTPGPEMSSSVPPCLVRRPAHACDLARSRAEHDRKDLVDVMKSAATARPGVVLVDPFEGLCDDDNCAAMRGGAVLYSDAHHWTVQGSLAVLPALRAALGNRVEP